MPVRVTGHSEVTTTDGHGIPSIRVLKERTLRRPSVFANRLLIKSASSVLTIPVKRET